MSNSDTSRPNLVYIFADDMGTGDVSCFNENSKWPTPCLDQLASGGLRCTDAHSSSAVCTPSRYSVLTGRYNWRSTLKSGFTTTLAVSMTGVSALSALGGAVPASRWLPVASLWGEGPTLLPLAIALCMGAASSLWFASRQR